MSFEVEKFTRKSIPRKMMTEHYKELAPLKHMLKMAPDWKFYEAAQAAGELIFVTLREVDDKAMTATLVGYMLIVLRPHPHYKGTKVAVDDVHYLSPAYRGGGWGKALISTGELAAKGRGAKVFSMRCKAESNHGYIFEAMGYKLTDLVYLKDLTNAP